MIRRLALGCVLAGVLAVTGGLVAVSRAGRVTDGVGATLARDTGTVPLGGRAVHRPGVTTLPAGSRLTLPRLGVDARIVDVRLAGSVMQVPRDPRVLGWWRGGAAPGAGHGSVVIVGHVDYAGTPGALGVLPAARPGDAVRLAGYRYRVVAVRSYPKSVGIPDSAFTAGGRERLVLVTCGGPFDARTGNYLDNVVVYALPA